VDYIAKHVISNHSRCRTSFPGHNYWAFHSFPFALPFIFQE
jgi:hypothetical protein